MKPSNSNDQAACIGSDPRIFDLAQHFPDALDTCAGCNVRLWCMQWVNPAENFYDGVVGGHVWSNGRPVRNATTETDLPLAAYLSQLQHRIETVPHYRFDNQPADPAVVDGFLNGEIPWHLLTYEERRTAATELLKQGVNTTEAMKRCHLNHRTIRAIAEAIQ